MVYITKPLGDTMYSPLLSRLIQNLRTCFNVPCPSLPPLHCTITLWI